MTKGTKIWHEHVHRTHWKLCCVVYTLTHVWVWTTLLTHFISILWIIILYLFVDLVIRVTTTQLPIVQGTQSKILWWRWSEGVYLLLVKLGFFDFFFRMFKFWSFDFSTFLLYIESILQANWWKTHSTSRAIVLSYWYLRKMKAELEIILDLRLFRSRDESLVLKNSQLKFFVTTYTNSIKVFILVTKRYLRETAEFIIW